MTARTVTRRAPGKLFVAGEYAVMEPGHPAILVAVDRHVAVTVTGSGGEDVVIDSDLRPEPARWRRGGDGLGPMEGRTPDGLTHVVSAIEVVDALLAERGPRPSPMRVSIRSDLHRAGTKLGLGSSGAVTVATVSAVAAHQGLDLSTADRFRLALLASARRDPGGSGGDLAAAVWGGWIAYRAPDRDVVLDLARRRGVEEALRAPWPGLGLCRLPPPRGLALEVGWTGRPADTAALAGRLGARARRDGADSPPGAWHDFLTRSDACVRASIRALERGDDHELLRRVRDARKILADLDDKARLGIFTPELTALCDAAESVGGAAKPSGAGGGDCGIALLDAGADQEIARLRDGWTAAGVHPLPIGVRPPEGNTE
ncbi:phosphomevalonate kinase [Actinomadura pelletieri DSM 43383]|uniref:phosphomevalonate kinase n=1 Tax=Actinomadura pelletieri DSM 43383 TaxID=1120940 RepID=A0A495QKI8_9ACTN|nr:phosphomevalonate kinase [Actinomadura pelletieri]RKS73107.1 phosphomevalonate kinase [Actinomadura pelletieri DSM 43383]